MLLFIKGDWQLTAIYILICVVINGYGKVLFLETSQLLRIRSISFPEEFRTVWFDFELLKSTVPFFKGCCGSQSGTCCILFLLPDSFNGRSVHTWSRWRGRWVHFGNVSSCWRGRVLRLFSIFCIPVCFLLLFSYFFWRFICLFRC